MRSVYFILLHYGFELALYLYMVTKYTTKLQNH